MQYRKTEEKDIPALKEMWKEIFLDCDTYVDLFFESKMKPEYTFLAVHGDEIAGAVYAVDAPLICADKREIPALYMCGISTRPAYRGQGIAGTLIENCCTFAKGIGKEACYLIPANQPLFDFYKRFGFEKAAYADKIAFPAIAGEVPPYKAGYAPELCNMYEQLVLPFKPKRSEKDFQYICSCYSHVLRFPEGYIVLEEQKDSICLLEQSFPGGIAIAQKIAGNNGKKLTAIVPKDGSGTPFAVVRKLSETLDLPSCGYINLMLN